MKAHDIFHQSSDEQTAEILEYLHQHNKASYRACLQLLASRRKLRPVILERRTRAERHAWMRTELARKTNADPALEVLQTWLLGAHQAMICEFLDAMGIPHDGQGLLESLPPEPPPEKLQAAVAQLFQNHPPVVVAIYLYLFAELAVADWPGTAETLNKDPRLCLLPNPQTPAA